VTEGKFTSIRLALDCFLATLSGLERVEAIDILPDRLEIPLIPLFNECPLLILLESPFDNRVAGRDD
jgi:hypothetical protein